MAIVALIPSVLGLRPSFYAFADALRDHGTDVRVVDIFDGGSRDTYEQGMALLDETGTPELMRRVTERTRELPGGFVPVGFSMGAVAAQYLATEMPVRGAVLLAGADPMTGWVKPWPKGVPAQIHVKEHDEFATPEEVVGAVTAIEEAGGRAELYRYPGSGHLFMDRDLPDEYDAAASDLVLERVVDFLERID